MREALVPLMVTLLWLSMVAQMLIASPGTYPPLLQNEWSYALLKKKIKFSSYIRGNSDRSGCKGIYDERPPHIHCEKSLFVLASRQKIPVLRTENPAVDTRTIRLLPIEFFKITHARKLRPENSGQKQQIRPKNPGLLVPEKVRPENPGE